MMHAQGFARKLKIALIAAVLGSCIGLVGAHAAARLLSTGGCLVDGGNFVSANGGCEDSVTGLTYSASSGYATGNVSMSYDQAMSYCSKLGESGYSDWRAPTISELTAMAADGGANHLELAAPGFALWSSTKKGNKAYAIVPDSGYVMLKSPNSGFDIACVR